MPQPMSAIWALGGRSSRPITCKATTVSSARRELKRLVEEERAANEEAARTALALATEGDDEPKPWLDSDHPGAPLFKKCARCHSLSANGRRRSGPHLSGLFGRPAGSVKGYNYSDALTGVDFRWNKKTLFQLFDQGPDKYLPGTKMPVQRVPDSEKLTQFVDYLKEITQAAPQ